MQNTAGTTVVRMLLEKAKEDGLDPSRIYTAAVRLRLPQWSPAPPTAPWNRTFPKARPRPPSERTRLCHDPLLLSRQRQHPRFQSSPANPIAETYSLPHTVYIY
jgi:hypothetical protein